MAQLSVVLVSIGIIVATVSAPPKPRGKPPTIQSNRGSANLGIPDHIQYFIGVGILSLALIISAFMGLFQERTYAKYGRSGAVWQESIFWSHAMSLPFFVPFLSNISNDFAIISNTPPTMFRLAMPFGVLPNKYPGTPTSNVLAIGIPSAWIAFAANIVTQGLCVNGVNRLTSVSVIGHDISEESGTDCQIQIAGFVGRSQFGSDCTKGSQLGYLGMVLWCRV